MIKFIIKRILTGIVTIWFIWSLVFVLVRISGDPIEWMLPDGASVEMEDELRSSLGLDLPLHEQYIKSFVNLFNGDLGMSYHYKRSVSSVFSERIGHTYAIGFPSYLLSIFFGVSLGIVAATKRNSVIDRIVMTSTTAFHTVPGFAFGIILVLIFSLWLRILPSGNTGSWKNMVLPIISMTVGPTSSIARLTRSSMLDTLQKEYLDGARMKGAKEKAVILKHALRNSLIPVVTSVAMQLGTIIGGAVVVETVFGWPGIGSLLVTSATYRDFPVVQYGVLIISIFVTAANVLVDILYGWLNPKIREEFK